MANKFYFTFILMTSEVLHYVLCDVYLSNLSTLCCSVTCVVKTAVVLNLWQQQNFD